MRRLILFFCLIAPIFHQAVAQATRDFPPELVNFQAYQGNPVFTGTGTRTWDSVIRERGWILKEGADWHLWYTGYTDLEKTKWLGYARSRDGIHWTRYKDNPLSKSVWVEDMCVVRSGNTYFMFAEGRGDTAHLLVSMDRIHWTDKGNLDIRSTNGERLKPGPFGTPTAWKEGNVWNLFYERNDSAIWLARSTDLFTWTNVQDEPVLKAGPEAYDRHGVAMNQVIRYKGLYYGYYHATAFADWHEWSTNVAVSEDLVHWTKYPKNPIIKNNRSSGILVDDGKQWRLYTMHPEVNLFFPANQEKQ